MNKTTAAAGGWAWSAVASAVLATCLPTSATAMGIDTGNPDLTLRWDNTLRYNLGVRAEGIDPRIASNPMYDESDNKFDRGSVVSNRVDWLTEVDLTFQRSFGLRVSAAAWYDQAYHDTTTVPSPGMPCNYTQCQYNATTQRYYKGASGEVLDAFVFGRVDVGSAIVNLKLGQHTVYWGEGLLLGSHAISYSQAPLDGRKAFASPGIETKEVFLPINQLSFNAQLTPDLTLAGQYFLDWKPTRAPLGGTYLGPADILGADQLQIPPGVAAPAAYGWIPVPIGAPIAPAKKQGNHGLAMRWKVPEMDTTVGAYYRQFDDYNPWGAVVGSSLRMAYANNVRLYGVSAAKEINGVSVGWELSYRPNAPLNAADQGGIDPVTHEGPRGRTWHMVLNGLGGLPSSPLWDTGTYIAELAVGHLSKVTQNAAMYKGVGYAGCVPLPGTRGQDNGCSTNNYTGLSFLVNPQYLQVLPGLDLTVPISLSYGLHGNAANAGGAGNQGELSWSIGLQANYLQKHDFTLQYQDRRQKTLHANGVAVAGNGSLYPLNDRGYVSFTYKYGF